MENNLESTNPKTTASRLALESADAAYVPFSDFSAWSELAIDDGPWKAAQQELQKVSADASPEVLKLALEVVQRAAAIDTGAIEGLYDVDKGVTITFATEGALLEAQFGARKELARRLIESQLAAYEYVLDFATRSVPIAEAWIRELHASICEHQPTYQVTTAVGPQEHELRKGEYKTQPNHVEQPDGSLHAYAPVAETPHEMHRLCEQVASTDFLSASPVVQSAYIHHAFTAVHPFSDGNGRVARALASVFTYRSARVPILILVEHRTQYLQALRAADSGDFGEIVDFVGRRFQEGIRMARESLQTARGPRIADQARQVGRLLQTRGGYSHSEVDQAGMRVLALFQKEVLAFASERLREQGVSISTGRTKHSVSMSNDFRALVGKAENAVNVQLSLPDPAGASANRMIAVHVPRDAAGDDEIVLASKVSGDGFSCRVDETIPDLSTGATIRLRMFIEQVVAGLLEQLHRRGAQRMKELGY